MSKIRIFWLLLLIIFLGIFLRLWKINEFPLPLSHDEVSQAYDAISVAKTGKDIYGNFMPTIFKSIDDYKSPFYTYSTTAVYLLIGNNPIMIRIPGLLFGILTIAAVFWFSLKLTNQPIISLLASFFTAIAPFEIFFSRKSFENEAGIFFLLVAFSSLLTYLERKERERWLYLGLISSAVGMYTYFSHAILIPLMLGVFILIFRKKLNEFKRYVIPFALWIILVAPLFFIVVTNTGARYRSQTVFVTQDLNLARQITNSIYSNELINLISHIKAISDFSFNRYLQQFDPRFLFADGLDLTNQGLLNSGPLLLLQLPLVLLGMIFLISQNKLAQSRKLLFFLILLGALPSGLTFEVHSPHRMIVVFTMLDILCGIGTYSLLMYFKKVKFKNILVILFAISLLINEIYFLHIYFVNYPYEKSQNLQYPFKQVAQFVWSNYNSVDSIVIDPTFGESAPVFGVATQYYLAYYGAYPPDKLQKSLAITSNGMSFDKFYIRKVDWRTDQNLKSTLVIASPWQVQIDKIDKNKLIKTFTFYDGQVAFYALKL